MGCWNTLDDEVKKVITFRICLNVLLIALSTFTIYVVITDPTIKNPNSYEYPTWYETGGSDGKGLIAIVVFQVIIILFNFLMIWSSVQFNEEIFNNLFLGDPIDFNGCFLIFISSIMILLMFFFPIIDITKYFENMSTLLLTTEIIYLSLASFIILTIIFFLLGKLIIKLFKNVTERQVQIVSIHINNFEYYEIT